MYAASKHNQLAKIQSQSIVLEAVHVTVSSVNQYSFIKHNWQNAIGRQKDDKA